MTDWIPDSIVLKALFRPYGYAYYMNETEAVRGYVRCTEESVFSPLARIQVERARISPRFVHLRFNHSNKYWARRGPGSNDYWIVASSNQPEEDTSKLSCTMFEPSLGDQGRLYFRHVQSGGIVRIDHRQTGDMSARLYVFDGNLGDVQFDQILFVLVNWQTLVKMPKRVTFKGDNDKYLQATMIESQPLLQFSSDDFNKRETAYEIELNDDGNIRIKSDYFGGFLRLGPNNWILGDSRDGSGNNTDTLFWPVTIRGASIAFRAAGNNNFCRRLSDGNRRDCLSATVATMTREAQMELRELVLERHIYHVRFRMEDARIFDEHPIIAGIGTAVNNTDIDSTLAIRVAYEEKRSYSFSNSTSITTGVTTTISTGIPRIMAIGIEISNEETNTFEWGETFEETRTAEATYTTTVPARSRVRVDYVATQGTCSVPFSYTQRDKSSTDGQFIPTHQIDGIFTGVNYYSFHFDQPAFEPLTSLNETE